MTRRECWRRWIVGFGLLLSFVVFSSGCSSFKSALGLEEEPPPPPAPKYYDFPDVMVPEELSLKPEESVIYEAGGFKAGLLFFTGRVEVNSLVDFFRTYLPKDGWTLASSVKFTRVLLNFVKPDRTCQIIIREKTLTTEVEVWVHPLRPTQS